MKTEDIEYNGQIFTCRKIIDFSAMIELLSALAKKQEYLEKKVNFHDERINDKDNRISELEIMIKGSSQSKEEKFPSEKEFSKDKKEKEEEDEEEKEEKELNDSLDKFLEKDNKSEKKEKDEEEKDESKKDEDNKEETKEENKEDKEKEENEEKKDEEKKEEEKKEEEKKDEEEENKEKNKDEDNKEIKIEAKTTEKKKENEVNKENENVEDKKDENSNNNNDEVLKKIIKKLKILEAKINNLEKLESTETRTTIIGKPSKKSGGEHRINALKKQMDEYEEQLKKINEDIAKIKEKVEDLNIYDLFKSDSGDGNIDICKGLVMALENKVFKKFGFYDVKFKKNDGDIFQNQSDIKNINALIDGIKEKENKTTDEINEIKNNNEQRHIDLNKLIKELNEKINEIDEKINKNNKINSNEHKDLGDKIKELEQRMQQQNDNIDISKYVKDQGQMNPEDLKLLKDLSLRINEVEKVIKITLAKLSPKEIHDRLDNLESEIVKKGNKYEISELSDRLLYYDENEKDLNYKMDTLQQYNEKARGDMQQIIKKIEYLSGELNRIANDNSEMDKGKGPIVDVTKLVDMNFFNESKKEINKKFDKVRLSFEEIARNLDDILEKLSHTPSDSDFAQFQSIIKNMVEELKLSLSKKYAEKNETNKSIKFLETQIKTIQDSFTKKMEGQDNWLLAKKPLNNYVCASCESILKGELDKRSEYIPWNRYPNRDEKSYRMGHGFSRMLQMINEDKKKYQDMKEKDHISDDERSRSDSEPNMIVNGSLKLPKLKHKHLHSGKRKNSNINTDEDNNIPFDKNNPYVDIDPIVSADRPKIMKIYKRAKQVIQSSYLNRNIQMKNEHLPNLIVTTSPNEKEVQVNKAETITQPNEE